MTETMQWSHQQSLALDLASRWLKAHQSGELGVPQIFRLFGFAGTGKSTIAMHLAEDLRIAFCAFTGKAALVLRSKGCDGASTIHRLIYKPQEKLIFDPKNPGKVIGREFVFNLKPVEELRDNYDLIIVDECSMVDQDLGRDLESFGIPILVLGDPGQLPPVKGTGYFTEHTPDICLTEIHRQARDNPIIALSEQVRQGRGRLEPGRYGDSRVFRRKSLDQLDLQRPEQVICGLNRTRTAANELMRKQLGFKSIIEANDKLVCLRNEHRRGLLNGSLWEVVSLPTEEPDPDEWYEMTGKYPPRGDGQENALFLKVGSIDFDAEPLDVYTHPAFINGTASKDLDFREHKYYSEFTYGYCLTCHKAQGSQWNDLLVINESYAFRDDATKWLYTAITRAAERIEIAM